ncbi:hypothetical protein [[Phormidium] sp. ETS-05]|uniref:hypothetical protein n=1 Tax=[Phormidium] sp. ETS-05 TaxID=222819 RepID=UPI0018EF0D93|nr:hypothetical protein [[Phormidium] sp. ETS-05]
MPVACCLVTKAGKQYVTYEGDKLAIQNLIAAELSLLEEELPEIELPKWSGIANPTLYGMTKHSSLFAPRQLLVLLRLLRGLRTVYHQICTRVNSDAARAVIACLSGLIDQLVDWNCALSVWLPTNEQVGRSLAGPGLPMQWNFVEINPLGTGPANLWDKLKRIVQAVATIPQFAQVPLVISGTATQIDLPDGCVDAIVTDPPYADNLYYSLLADCIYNWKRLGLRHIFPEDFQYPASPTASEIVASTKRQGSSEAAMSFYRNELQAALAEGYRLLKPDGILSLIFTHSTLEGWITIFSAILGAGFHPVTAWPFCIERKARPRGMAKGAINASCVIVAAKEIGDYPKPDSLFIERQVKNLAASLTADGWNKTDIGMALFVHRTALCLRGIDSGAEIGYMIKECYEVTRNLIADFQLTSRKML